MRGGTSKGLMFLDENLPVEDEKRFEIFLKLLGAPDKYGYQLQGLGGGKSTNNKIGVVKKSQRSGIDVDFKFYQIHPKSSLVDTMLNCGNFISAVPIFAVMQKLVIAQEHETIVRIFNENTGQIIEAKMLSNGRSILGNYELDGVSGLFSPIELRFLGLDNNIFPTGQKIDLIDGIAVTIANISVPMVIVDGEDLRINSSTSLVETLKGDKLLKTLYTIRKKAIELINMPADYFNYSIPKVCIAVPSTRATIKSYYYDPFVLHDSYAVTGGICLASTCLIKDTVANRICDKIFEDINNKIVIEYLNGTMEIKIEFDKASQKICSASIIRTATMLMEGRAYL